MQAFWQDVRYGIRTLARRPGFTIVAALTLALGIGANTAVFSFVNALFLRPMNVPQGDRIVRFYGVGLPGVRSSDHGPGGAQGQHFDVFSYPNYADVRDRSRVFAALAAHQNVTVSLSTEGDSENTPAELVTGNYFSVFTVSPALGRALQPSDDVSEGAHPLAVISHGLWKRRYGASPDVLGRVLHINGHPYTIVGVMPESFRGTFEAYSTDLWVPLAMHGQVRPRGLSRERRGWGWLYGSGRLKPGVTIAQAQADLARVVADLHQDRVLDEEESFEIFRAGALPEQFRKALSGVLGFSLLVVTLVLLVACANIASVLLARAVARRREVAIRQSLGASRGRLLRQWVTESLLLSLGGGVFGLLTAFWWRDAMLLLVPPGFDLFVPVVDLDWRVLAFTFAVTVLAGLLFGIVPALRASQVSVSDWLKDEAGATAGGAHRGRVFGAFVVGQVAVSLVLLIAAGLLLRSLREAEAFDPGFDTKNLSLVTVDLRRHQFPEENGWAFYRQLLERVERLPGARSATMAIVVPLGIGSETQGYRIPGHTPPKGQSAFSIDNNLVWSGYFATMGIPVVRGRAFDRTDRLGSRPVAVINETMARRFWPDGDPVGQSIELVGRGPLEIIGVVRDIKHESLGESSRPYVYGSLEQFYWPLVTLHVRSHRDDGALLPAIKGEVQALDPNVAVSEAMTFAELRRLPLFPNRAMALVSGLFGAVALALTALGVYGIVSYAVTRQTRAIGIRVALGAQRADILRLVVGQGMLLVALGVMAGAAVAWGATRYLSSLLFGVTPTDPLTFAAVALAVLAVALLACWIPARRALRVDPMVALRYE